MPRYFFDIHDGGSQHDEAGTECADLAAARMQAVQPLPDIAHEEIPQDGDRRTFTVLVTEENERPVYSATLAYAGLWLLR
ncbi:hypothetical protein Q8W71_29190 [Methylobacterium sp. NEAU 140]|uniref:DUF6894 family protein n=1 Tax=Methylobacterium sp. NEAU 140 TaxID=3064945 RepID=UPI00273698D1|nr:hypothetical protein [Methylobacterium sp. NEAU 140]MDP4026686.1 hypothetical protein [Methylobacterium sp. NEAU 140]